MNIRLENKSVRVRVTQDEALRLEQEGTLKNRWLLIQTNSPEGLVFEQNPAGFLFRLTQQQLRHMLKTDELELEQEGELDLRFEIDRFTVNETQVIRGSCVPHERFSHLPK